MKNYIGVDFGASTGRVILGTLKNNKMEYEEIHRFPTEGTYVFDTFRWNILRFWEEVKIGLRKLSKIKNLNIQGIGVDSWGVNLVYLTGDLELSCQPFHYRDSLIEEGMKYSHKILDMAEVYDITGIQDINLNGLIHIAGIHRQYPEILKRTKKILMIPDYFNYLLTGNLTTEYTNATTTELLDARTHEWSDKLLDPFGLQSSSFPKMKYPGNKIGELHSSVQEQTGLPPIPIYSIASHDTGSAVIAVPASNEKWAYLSSGTWSLLGVEIDEPIINDKVRELNLTNEGGAFGKIRFLKNIMGLWLLQRSKVEWDKEYAARGEDLEYDVITAKAAAVESNRSIIKVDAPEFFNPKNMINAIQNHCKENGQPIPRTIGEIARCIYDSLAIRYREVLEMIQEATGTRVDSLHIVGGGSQDDLLNQLTANELNMNVYAGPVEATAIGNIMMQAYADGSVKDLAEIRNIVRKSFAIKEYIPK